MNTAGRFLACLTLAAPLFAGPEAFAQSAAFSYNDGVGIGNVGSYAPGSSFTFAINIAFTPGGAVTDLDGISYWFEQQNPGSPFNFAITNRDVTGSNFTVLQTTSLTYPQSLTPQNARDLGALAPGSGFGAGTYFVANLTVSISPSAAPGTYFIENTTTGGKTSVVTDDFGHTFAIPRMTYEIDVVPEPATWAAGAMIGAALLVFHRRRVGQSSRSRRG